MRVYLSGPMRGYAQLNYAAFAAYAADLRTMGYTVFSPPELSEALRRSRGLAPRPSVDEATYSDVTDGLTFEDYYREDVKAIAECDIIAMMPGWEASVGAKKEYRLGSDLKLAIVWADDLRGIAATGYPLYSHTLARPVYPESSLEEAQRLVHGDRGVDYGHPYDNDRRIAGQLKALFGWPVKISDVWRIVAAIKLSREGFRPKRDNRVDLGGYAETGEMVQQRLAAGYPDDPYAPIPANLA